MNQDDPLTPDERAALERLPREMTTPSALEDRVVARLRESGAIRSRRRVPALAAAAAILLLTAGGFALGRLTSGSAPLAGDQYALLLYGAGTASPGEEAARVSEYAAWAREERTAGRLVAAEKLEDASFVAGSAANAPAAGTGPLGFFVIRAASADEARAIASRCPHVKHGGAVVVQAVAR